MIGCTVSTIGGLLNGIARAAEFGYACTQIYTSKSRRWDVYPLEEAVAKEIHEYSSEKNVQLVAHIPFLVNLSSPNSEQRKKSVERIKIEIVNAGYLGINKLVLHPGSAVSKSCNSYEPAIEHIISGLDDVANLCLEHSVTILLETMSGQGTEIGINFDELKNIIFSVKHPEVLGVCFDTAHVFAAGYDISSIDGFNKTIQEFDKCIGIDKLGCFHLNNTKIQCGKRVDRHSSIFDGEIALEVFAELVKNPRFSDVPKIIEPTASDDDSFGYIQVNYLKALKEGTHMVVDRAVEKYFNKNIKQVFVYLTNKCQLRCKQCLYKPLLDNCSDDLELDILVLLLRKFKEYGAFKLSFLGGEPTLYKDKRSGVDFSKVVEISKSLGYSYVRVDTNGQFESSFLENENVQKLDEITFSIDGYDAKTHDAMRGKGVFDKCVSNIKHAVELGYKVQVTACFHNGLCEDENTGVESILKLVSLCEEIGVQSLNLHPILKVGAARDNWIDSTEINPHLWLEIYHRVQRILSETSHSVNIRLPMRYVKKNLLDKSHEYCPLKMGERALIMLDGTIKVCAFNIGTPHCLARFSINSITYEQNNNELSKLNNSTAICCNQSSQDDLCALCMSYKPQQDELVWKSVRGNV